VLRSATPPVKRPVVWSSQLEDRRNTVTPPEQCVLDLVACLCSRHRHRGTSGRTCRCDVGWCSKGRTGAMWPPIGRRPGDALLVTRDSSTIVTRSCLVHLVRVCTCGSAMSGCFSTTWSTVRHRHIAHSWPRRRKRRQCDVAFRHSRGVTRAVVTRRVCAEYSVPHIHTYP
jgi:hypothetical protein